MSDVIQNMNASPCMLSLSRKVGGLSGLWKDVSNFSSKCIPEAITGFLS